MKIKQKNYLAFLNKKLKYDLMNYKFLKCNKLCTVEYLNMYLSKKRWLKKVKNKKITKTSIITPKKLLDRAESTKMYNKIYTKYYNKQKKVQDLITERWKNLQKNQKLKEDEDYKLIGKVKTYLSDWPFLEKKWLLPYKKWNYHKRVLFWNKRKLFTIKFANFLNYFNNERCLIYYKREYIYNKTEYSVVQINLTPNNISIVVTKANGDIRFWGTSGTKKFKGARKHTFYAIKSIARTMYYKILAKKIKNLKIVYRGRPNKIRLREVLRIFRQGAKWNKYDILAIIDMTPLPFNGCRKSKKRR